MDRRSALKNIGKAAGLAVATPSIMSILASCNSDIATWKPTYLSATQGYMITQLVDIIIPKGKLPGGLEVNIPEFIDIMFRDVETEESQKAFTKGAEVFEAKFKEVYEKEAIKGKKEEYHEILDIYFKITENERNTIFEDLRKDVSEIAADDVERYHIYDFLTTVRRYTLDGYFSSEKIGEEILAYDPIPGQYIECGSLEELTGGKSWSI